MKNILLFLLLATNVNLFSQNWTEVTKDKFGNKFFIKSKIVSKGDDFGYNQDIIKIWTKQIIKKVTDQRSKSKGKVYLNAYMLQLMEYDCKNMKLRVISSTAYSANGAVFGSEDFGSFADWEDVIPDSVGETMIEKVCELYN